MVDLCDFQHERSKGAKARKFLGEMLQRKGPTAFERFVAALKECDSQKFIAEELIGEDGTDDPGRGGNASQGIKCDDDIIQEVSGLYWQFVYY